MACQSFDHVGHLIGSLRFCLVTSCSQAGTVCNCSLVHRLRTHPVATRGEPALQQAGLRLALDDAFGGKHKRMHNNQSKIIDIRVLVCYD